MPRVRRRARRACPRDSRRTLPPGPPPRPGARRPRRGARPRPARPPPITRATPAASRTSAAMEDEWRTDVARRRMSRQAVHRVAPLDERAHERGTRETRDAGDEHAQRPPAGVPAGGAGLTPDARAGDRGRRGPSSRRARRSRPAGSSRARAAPSPRRRSGARPRRAGAARDPAARARCQSSPTTAKAVSTSSRTECASPVATT